MVLGWRLDLMILEVFSNLNDSVILTSRNRPELGMLRPTARRSAAVLLPLT